MPAALNGIAALKPTRGLVSAAGVVPACRSLDCVGVFAATPRDAAVVAGVMAGVDLADPWSREMPGGNLDPGWWRPLGRAPRVGVLPDDGWFPGDEAAAAAQALDEAGDLGIDDLDGEAGGLLSDEDLELAAEALAPDSSAALIVWEQQWAARVAEAIRGAGGEIVAGERIPPDVVEAAMAGL